MLAAEKMIQHLTCKVLQPLKSEGQKAEQPYNNKLCCLTCDLLNLSHLLLPEELQLSTMLCLCLLKLQLSLLELLLLSVLLLLWLKQQKAIFGSEHMSRLRPTHYSAQLKLRSIFYQSRWRSRRRKSRGPKLPSLYASFHLLHLREGAKTNYVTSARFLTDRKLLGLSW